MLRRGTGMNCAYCGLELTGKYQNKFCSVKCQKDERSMLAKEKRKRTCVMCKKEFVMPFMSAKARRGEIKSGVYCSRKCRWDAVRQQSKKLREPRPLKPCKICGKETHGRHEVYCSDECRKENARRQSFKLDSNKKELKCRVCKECGGTFTPEYGNKRRYFCSDICLHKTNKRQRRQKERARIRNVRIENVNAVRVFERDGWRCQSCSARLRRKDRGTFKETAPELDHIIPLSKGGEHSYRNTQCLCRKCNSEKGNNEIGQLRMFG